MRRALPFILSAVVLSSHSAFALQLHRAAGSTDLTVTQNTQAVLVLSADSTDVALPNTLRLQWTADSLGLQFSPFDQACLVDTAGDRGCGASDERGDHAFVLAKRHTG